MGPSAELMASTSPKQQLPQFSAAFGHQLSSHSGIPKDLQPSHSSIAPPTGFTVTVTESSAVKLSECCYLLSHLPSQKVSYCR
ncbi:rCG22544 [Rattus norvegicus]|uniref:RCG22544 n=1 Tax=Rattus norvegicus TaxID=10116 RepID=A6IPF0_RAT|nr:rCG22544 [Rattus norvegicus]